MRRVSGSVVASFVVVVAVGVAGGSRAARADDTLKKIKETGAITLGNGDSSIPFVYFDDKHQAVGYSLDICYRVVDAIKAELKMSKIDVKLQTVNSATRIPLVVGGTVDLECGSTTNNVERQ